MTGCMGRRRRQGRHNRTPTQGRHIRSPFKFPGPQAINRSDTFASAASPAGLPLQVPSIDRHLRRLYAELKGPGEETLSAEKLQAFIRDVQKEEPKPLFDDTYSYQKFQEYWWNYHSRSKRPMKREKDIDHPFSQYFINSSHNTYIAEGDQFLGENKDVQYRKVSVCFPCPQGPFLLTPT